MVDAVDPVAAKAKLALSRAELLAAMGYEEVRDALGNGATAVVPLLQRAESVDTSSFGARLGRSAVARWWHRHPLGEAFELAQPLLRDYARRKPVKLVAYGAGAGALLWIIKPWKLLSVATVATLIFRNVDFAALFSGLVRKSGAASGTAAPAPLPAPPESGP